MIEALRTSAAPRSRPACCDRSKGVHLAFTGILSQAAPRRRSAPPAAPARSSTAGPPRRPPSSSAAGRTRCRPPAAMPGLKLMEIKRLREKGHRITLLNETQF